MLSGGWGRGQNILPYQRGMKFWKMLEIIWNIQKCVDNIIMVYSFASRYQLAM